MDPDLDLIYAIRQGQEDALVELLSRHKQSVFHFVLRSVGNQADAAELTEETFVKVYFGAPKFKPKAKVKTWIFTIATNLCRDYFRKHKKRKFQSLDAPLSEEGTATLLDQIPGNERSAYEEASTNELVAFLQKKIDALPERLKLPFIHCVLEERTQEEAARILNTTTKSIETRIYRARKQLKVAMTRRFS